MVAAEASKTDKGAVRLPDRLSEQLTPKPRIEAKSYCNCCLAGELLSVFMVYSPIASSDIGFHTNTVMINAPDLPIRRVLKQRLFLLQDCLLMLENDAVNASLLEL